VIERIWPRRSALTRPDVFYGHLQQVVVANADQLLVVASWRQPHFWPELVDRYLIAAQRSGLKAVLCVNKIDLAEDRAACEKQLQPFRRLGYDLLFTSAVTGEGIAGLQERLQGQITVLAGLSGVGKSSLLAAVQPGLELRVGQVSDWGDGRHTTTQVRLIELEAGGYVADTPGIREFGLSGLRRSELAQFYPEIATAARHCRFADCAHLSEPGCAIPAAVQQGRVSAMRYQSYCSIYGALTE
jgi:ribosome biogenesis GTPase